MIVSVGILAFLVAFYLREYGFDAWLWAFTGGIVVIALVALAKLGR